MKAILCIPPPVSPDHPLLGVASIASVIRERGVEVEVLDLNIALMASDELPGTLWRKEGFDSWSLPEFLEEVWPIIGRRLNTYFSEAEPANIFGLHVTSASRGIAQRIAEEVRKCWPSTTIIAGGPDFFFPAAEYGYVGPYDFTFRGEAEATLSHWLSDFSNNSLSHNFGAANQCLPVCLDDIPLPIFDIFPLDAYNRKGVFPMEVSRGCVNQCCYCDDSRMWKIYRRKSPRRITKELVAVAALGARQITFCDSILNPSPAYFAEFLDLVGESGLPWDGMAQPKKIDREVAQRMRMSGCNHIFLGIESFSDRFLTLLNKGNSARCSQEAIESIAQEGIDVSIGFIVAGAPLQTRREFEHDMSILRKLAPFLHSVAINPLCIPTGTPLADRGLELGIHSLNSQLSWKFWHCGGHYNEIHQRLQWCREAAQTLTEAGVSLGANYNEFDSYVDKQLTEAEQYFTVHQNG